MIDNKLKHIITVSNYASNETHLDSISINRGTLWGRSKSNTCAFTGVVTSNLIITYDTLTINEPTVIINEGYSIKSKMLILSDDIVISGNISFITLELNGNINSTNTQNIINNNELKVKMFHYKQLKK